MFNGNKAMQHSIYVFVVLFFINGSHHNTPARALRKKESSKLRLSTKQSKKVEYES